MFGDLSTASPIGFRVVETDRQFKGRVFVRVAMNIDIHHARPAIGAGIADAAQNALDDVDVMLSAIQVHAG